MSSLSKAVSSLTRQVQRHTSPSQRARGVASSANKPRPSLRVGDARHAGVGRLRLELGFQAQAQLQHALLAAAQRQDAVRGQGAQRLVEVEPVAEIGAFGFLAVHHLRVAGRWTTGARACRRQVRVLGVALCEDVAGAVQRGLASVIEASGFRYCAASAPDRSGSARMASASGSRPASRAIWRACGAWACRARTGLPGAAWCRRRRFPAAARASACPVARWIPGWRRDALRARADSQSGLPGCAASCRQAAGGPR